MNLLQHAAVTAMLGMSLTALAQETRTEAATAWPKKPVRLVVAHSAGGGSDVLARLLSQKLATTMGSGSFVVENKPGAAGNIASAFVAGAVPDGYTFLVTTASVAVNPSLYKNPGYRLGSNLVGVTQLASVPLALVTYAPLKIVDVPDLIAKYKGGNRGLNSASNGSGTTSHLAAVMFAQATGLNVINIPYKGSAPAVTSLMGGETEIGFTSIISVKSALDSGRVKALAVTTKTRSPDMPELPTLATYVPGFEIDQWYGVFAPSGVEPIILKKLNDSIREVLNSPEVSAFLRQEGATAIGSTQEAFAHFLSAEAAKYKKLVESTNLQIE